MVLQRKDEEKKMKENKASRLFLKNYLKHKHTCQYVPDTCY